MEHNDWKTPMFGGETPPQLISSGFPPLLSAVLHARGIDTPHDAEGYLSRAETLLREPFLFKDMKKAVSRIKAAMDKEEKVAVFGDYDVDGITSSCLVTSYLRSCGMDCTIYIPDRIEEGYGMNVEALEHLRQLGVTLVITVDCGITAVSEVEAASSMGMDVIITDHHECQPLLPEAVAIIDPKCPDSAYPFDGLAGVGVAFKLVCALEGDYKEPLRHYADLVAAGTIADIMPLTGENRFLVYAGLTKMKTSPCPGFLSLMKESGATERPLNANTVGFSLAPRINAAGRLCKTETATKLLLTEDAAQADSLAKELCELNRRRQELETKVWDEAVAILEDNPPKGPIVLRSESWHPGVVGIAASRLSEAYGFPTIMICLDGDMGKGSCRSYGDFNLFEAISACAEYLEGFGGHAFAAGITIKRENIPAFTEALSQYYLAHCTDQEILLMPELLISDPAMLDLLGVSSLDMLEPCGSENPRPLMCLHDCRLLGVTPIGGGKHLRLKVEKFGVSFDCVFFSHGVRDINVSEGEWVDICFFPQINEFRSVRSVQLMLSGIRPARSSELCQRLLSEKEPFPEMLTCFRPRREELGRIWRFIRQKPDGVSMDFCDPSQAQNAAGIDPVKLCLGLLIFRELGLLNLHGDESRASASIRTDSKTDLSASAIFRSLWKL